MCFVVIIEDFYKGFFCKNVFSIELVWVGCLMVLFIFVIVIIIVYDFNLKVMGLVFYVWVGFGVVFGLVVIFFFFNCNISLKVVLWGMLFGVIIVVVWSLFMRYLGWDDLFKFYEIIFGFLVCLFIILILFVFVFVYLKVL